MTMQVWQKNLLYGFLGTGLLASSYDVAAVEAQVKLMPPLPLVIRSRQR